MENCVFRPVEHLKSVRWATEVTLIGVDIRFNGFSFEINTGGFV